MCKRTCKKRENTEMTKVVNIKDGEYFDVYIGRGSKWGNPFKIGRDGSRKGVIALYRQWLPTNYKLMNDLMELDGKILGCFCKPKACHGDVLVEFIEAKKREKILTGGKGHER